MGESGMSRLEAAEIQEKDNRRNLSSKIKSERLSDEDIKNMTHEERMQRMDQNAVELKKIKSLRRQLVGGKGE
jgi:hypothetical protein